MPLDADNRPRLSPSGVGLIRGQDMFGGARVLAQGLAAVSDASMAISASMQERELAETRRALLGVRPRLQQIQSELSTPEFASIDEFGTLASERQFQDRSAMLRDELESGMMQLGQGAREAALAEYDRMADGARTGLVASSVSIMNAGTAAVEAETIQGLIDERQYAQAIDAAGDAQILPMSQRIGLRNAALQSAGQDMAARLDRNEGLTAEDIAVIGLMPAAMRDEIQIRSDMREFRTLSHSASLRTNELTDILADAAAGDMSRDEIAMIARGSIAGINEIVDGMTPPPTAIDDQEREQWRENVRGQLQRTAGARLIESYMNDSEVLGRAPGDLDEMMASLPFDESVRNELTLMARTANQQVENSVDQVFIGSVQGVLAAAMEAGQPVDPGSIPGWPRTVSGTVVYQNGMTPGAHMHALQLIYQHNRSLNVQRNVNWDGMRPDLFQQQMAGLGSRERQQVVDARFAQLQQGGQDSWSAAFSVFSSSGELPSQANAAINPGVLATLDDQGIASRIRMVQQMIERSGANEELLDGVDQRIIEAAHVARALSSEQLAAFVRGDMSSIDVQNRRAANDLLRDEDDEMRAIASEVFERFDYGWGQVNGDPESRAAYEQMLEHASQIAAGRGIEGESAMIATMNDLLDSGVYGVTGVGGSTRLTFGPAPERAYRAVAGGLTGAELTDFMTSMAVDDLYAEHGARLGMSRRDFRSAMRLSYVPGSMDQPQDQDSLLASMAADPSRRTLVREWLGDQSLPRYSVSIEHTDESGALRVDVIDRSYGFNPERIIGHTGARSAGPSAYFGTTQGAQLVGLFDSSEGMGAARDAVRDRGMDVIEREFNSFERDPAARRASRPVIAMLYEASVIDSEEAAMDLAQALIQGRSIPDEDQRAMVTTAAVVTALAPEITGPRGGIADAVSTMRGTPTEDRTGMHRIVIPHGAATLAFDVPPTVTGLQMAQVASALDALHWADQNRGATPDEIPQQILDAMMDASLSRDQFMGAVQARGDLDPVGTVGLFYAPISLAEDVITGSPFAQGEQRQPLVQVRRRGRREETQSPLGAFFRALLPEPGGTLIAPL